MNICSYFCKNCSSKYPTTDLRYKCDCGNTLELKFLPIFNIDKIVSRKPNMWRYREAIPIIEDKNIVSFDEGFTPLLDVEFDNIKVKVKQDHLFPTGSYKDRGASVLISKIKELGITKVVEDSSGNAGNAIAAYCAKTNINCEILVPESTSQGKLTQIESYNAILTKIPGTREDTAKEALKKAEHTYYASHTWNPFFIHGTKTYAFEITEQLNWTAPDTIILPVGNGTILLGAYVGFNELYSAGITDKIPKLVGVQAANCAPLYNALFDEQKTITPTLAISTIAEGIAISEPVRGLEIIEAIENTKGTIICVTEDEIKSSLIQMHHKGYCIEPTSAATTAGIAKYISQINEKENIVSIFTGHGLKAM